jgi:hypothetical protein
MSEYDGKRGLMDLVLENAGPLPEPVPWRDRLGLWELPADVLQEAGQDA